MVAQRRRGHVSVRLEEQVPTDLLETEWTCDSGLLVYLGMVKVQAFRPMFYSTLNKIQ